MSDDPFVELVRIVRATPEEVFDAWLDPAVLSVFMKPAHGMAVRNVEVDARVGGCFSLTMQAGETEIPIRGEYVELSRPWTLAFTWLSSGTRPDSLVRLTFEPFGERMTRFTLHHVGFPDDDLRGRHDAGWNQIADLLCARFVDQ